MCSDVLTARQVIARPVPRGNCYWFGCTVVACWLVVLICTANAGVSHAVEFSTEEQERIALHGPWPLLVPPDPGNEFSGLSWAEEAGLLLFQDTGLSGNSEISCASCHQAAKGFSDGKEVAIGRDKHFRNTQTLLNVGLQRWFGWDGGTDSLWAATMRPLLSELEMDSSVEAIAEYLRRTPRYRIYLQRGANDESIGLDTISDEQVAVKAVKFIASYVRTIASGDTPFDQFRDALNRGETVDEELFSASARRGLKLFAGKANCHVCHYGANFSNGEFHDIGRPFFIGVGQVDPGRYRGIERLRTDRYNLSGAFNGTRQTNEIRKTESVRLSRSDWGRWRTPSLRNLVYTAPYMHDGSIATLREVIDVYSDIDPGRLHTEGESILKPLGLSEQEKEDLVAFLRTLSIPD